MSKIVRALLGTFALALLVVGSVFGYRAYVRERTHTKALPLAQPFVETFVTTTLPQKGGSTRTTSAFVVPRATSSTKELPRSMRLAIPFISQAPHKNWSLPYQEACEEASAIMAEAFLRGTRENLTPDEADTAILAFVAWQTERFGADRVSMTGQETAEAIEGYWPTLTTEIRPVKTANDLRMALKEGVPIILPANGKILNNPNFHNGGPPYHMLVLKGYLEDGRFITNDPGTRLGENFLYTEKNLLNAIHDWEGEGEANGPKKMILVRKK